MIKKANIYKMTSNTNTTNNFIVSVDYIEMIKSLDNIRKIMVSGEINFTLEELKTLQTMLNRIENALGNIPDPEWN